MLESIALKYDDYAQSANTLFHFMTQSNYLKSILKNKAIVPRHCMENIGYLNFSVGNIRFGEVAVLQKCFCELFDFACSTDDIPDQFSNDVLVRLSLIKPLRGIMKRAIFI